MLTLADVKDGKAKVPIAHRLDPLRLVYVAEFVDLRPLFQALEMDKALQESKK